MVWKWTIEVGDERAESAAQEPLYPAAKFQKIRVLKAFMTA